MQLCSRAQPEAYTFTRPQLFRYLALGSLGVVGVSAYSAESDHLRLAWNIPTRLIRDCVCAVTMILGVWVSDLWSLTQQAFF